MSVYEESPFEKMPRMERVSQARMSVVLLVDNSGSMDGKPMASVNRALSDFKAYVCSDSVAADSVDVLVITLGDGAKVVQNWTSVRDMQEFSFVANGMTDLAGGFHMGVEMLRDRSMLYAKIGAVEKKPYIVVFTDGYDNFPSSNDSYTMNSVADVVYNRVREGKLKVFFLGAGDYDKRVAAQLTKAEKCIAFELKDRFDYSEFFDFIANSVKAESVKSPGEALNVKTNVGRPESNVAVVDLTDWLNL